MGRSILIQTDNEGLTGKAKVENATGRVARWGEVIQAFHPKWEYKKGIENVNADALSRDIRELGAQSTESTTQVGRVRLEPRPPTVRVWRPETGAVAAVQLRETTSASGEIPRPTEFSQSESGSGVQDGGKVASFLIPGSEEAERQQRAEDDLRVLLARMELAVLPGDKELKRLQKLDVACASRS